jgi:hypothetical protein
MNAQLSIIKIIIKSTHAKLYRKNLKNLMRKNLQNSLEAAVFKGMQQIFIPGLNCLRSVQRLKGSRQGIHIKKNEKCRLN